MPRKKSKRRRIYSPPSNQQHSCGGCDFSFGTRDQLIKHKSESSNEDCRQGLIFCPQCKKGFISEYSLNMHYTKSPSCNILNDLPNAVSTIAFGSGLGPGTGTISEEQPLDVKCAPVETGRSFDDSDGYNPNEDSDEESIEPTKMSSESLYISIVNKSKSKSSHQAEVVTQRRSFINPSLGNPNCSSGSFSMMATWCSSLIPVIVMRGSGQIGQ